MKFKLFINRFYKKKGRFIQATRENDILAGPGKRKDNDNPEYRR
jgi:hypothetical protein